MILYALIQFFYDRRGMDRRLFYFFWDISQTHIIIRKASVFISKASRSFYFIAYVAACVYIAFTDLAGLPPFILIPSAVAASSVILRKIIKKPRPREGLGIITLIDSAGEYSFPSNHAAASAVISIACLSVSAITGVFLCAFAFITGVGRICAGLHYPSDIAAGWFLGVVFGVLFFFAPFMRMWL